MSNRTPVHLSRPKSASYAIADVVALAERGALRVPRFQRPFLWDARDVRLLFESIWRGFPIGTLLLWSRPSLAEVISFGPLKVDAPETKDALWVVDGQQRVTSLVAALGGARASRSEGNGALFDVYFDLRTAGFVHGGRRHPPAWWLGGLTEPHRLASSLSLGKARNTAAAVSRGRRTALGSTSAAQRSAYRGAAFSSSTYPRAPALLVRRCGAEIREHQGLRNQRWGRTLLKGAT